MIDLNDLRRRISSAPDHQGVVGATWINPHQALKLLDMLEAAHQNEARYLWLRTALADRERGVSHHFCSIRDSRDLDEAIDAAMQS